MKLSIAKELEDYITAEIESSLAGLRVELGKGLDDLAQGRYRPVTIGEFLARTRGAVS